MVENVKCLGRDGWERMKGLMYQENCVGNILVGDDESEKVDERRWRLCRMTGGRWPLFVCPFATRLNGNLRPSRLLVVP